MIQDIFASFLDLKALAIFPDTFLDLAGRLNALALALSAAIHDLALIIPVIEEEAAESLESEAARFLRRMHEDALIDVRRRLKLADEGTLQRWRLPIVEESRL